MDIRVCGFLNVYTTCVVCSISIRGFNVYFDMHELVGMYKHIAQRRTLFLISIFLMHRLSAAFFMQYLGKLGWSQWRYQSPQIASLIEKSALGIYQSP